MSRVARRKAVARRTPLHPAFVLRLRRWLAQGGVDGCYSGMELIPGEEVLGLWGARGAWANST
jgi:hypothetical protein